LLNTNNIIYQQKKTKKNRSMSWTPYNVVDCELIFIHLIVNINIDMVYPSTLFNLLFLIKDVTQNPKLVSHSGIELLSV